ncbi:peptidase S9 [Pacificimonas flava]|uniref:Peptidase S9 n=2 Tax=Pacificimonas TaxID=1960290 RepID=A0A219B545_9SPHN|nr:MULTISPECIES: prolyl oligopeptidase family serine peptidase [Pacificimonas]MBZ6379297.1 S9 family peptidase [Pacificimonas aurantium]OWV33495.1 peptidase S9 [Pacificimonas flava]
MNITTSAIALAALSLLASVSQVADAQERRTEGNLVIEGVPEIPAETEETLRRYVNVRGHSFDGFLPDGSLLIATRFGETAQIHRVTQPMGARRQLTFYDEPVASAIPHPQRAAFVFGKDTGGDEFYRGYYQDVDSGAAFPFTPEGARSGGFIFTDDGDRVAYFVAEDGNPDWRIDIAAPPTKMAPQTIYAGAGANYPTDFSADGQTLAVQRYYSASHSDLYLIDIASGVVTEVLPDEENAYMGGEVLRDGSVLTVSDRGADFANLVRISPDGSVTDLTPGIDWNVDGLALSPDETRAVFTVNEDGFGTLKIIDLASGAISEGPDLPAGIVYGPIWHPAGRLVGFTLTAATSPADVYSYDTENGDLTRWTEAELGGLNTSGFVEPELIRYPNDEGMEIPAFVYKPETEGPHPVIISIHGGPEGQSRPSFSSTYQYWVKELGAAVIRPNVRGSDGYGEEYRSMDNALNRKKSVEDIGALLDWIETQPDLDSEKVIVYGGSYGGYMVLASMVDYSDRLAGGIDIVGISDFRTFLENTKGYRRDLRRAEYGDERDPEIAAFFEEISPLRNADRITKPLFIIQGANDPRVPASEAEQILEAMRESGTEAWYLLAMDEGHGFRKQSNREYQRAAETLFLQQLLGE